MSRRTLFVLLIILIAIIILPISYSATISGKVYDSSLNIVQKAIIELEPPLQRFITNDGSYSFEVDPGIYNISVLYSDGTRNFLIQENVVIDDDDRNFNYDLFIFEDISEEEELSEEVVPDIDVTGIQEEQEKGSYLSQILIFSTLIAVLLILWVLRKDTNPNSQSQKEEGRNQDISSYEDRIISIIKDNQGSITQKELRKQMPYSEAKISIWITDLEDKGKIRKVKKGRGNIIILN